MYKTQWFNNNSLLTVYLYFHIKASKSISPSTSIVIVTKPSAIATSPLKIKPSKAEEPNLSENMSATTTHTKEQNEIIEIPTGSISPKVQIVSSHVDVITDNPNPSLTKKTVLTHKKTIISSKVEIKENKDIIVIPHVVSRHVDIKEAISPSIMETVSQLKATIYSSILEGQSNNTDEPLLQVENNIGDPEYDFLSRQPSEFAEETYRVHNIKPPNSKFTHKTRSVASLESKKQNTRNDELHPTGLVTKLGGTVVKEGATTIHETSVIGTYISGKYAQVLQSTSHIFHTNPKQKISPSSSLRILKTAAPHVPKQKQHIESTPTRQKSSIENESFTIEDLQGTVPGSNLIRSSRRPALMTGNFKNRFRNRNNKNENDLQEMVEVQTSQSITSTTSSQKLRNSSKPTK